MFGSMKSGTNLKIGYLGSKSRSLVHILEKPIVHSRGHIFSPIIISPARMALVSMSDSCFCGCEFDPRLRQSHFLAYFRLSPLQKHVRKVVGGFGKKSVCLYWCEKARKHICMTDFHDMTLAVKVALNPNTANQR